MAQIRFSDDALDAVKEFAVMFVLFWNPFVDIQDFIKNQLQVEILLKNNYHFIVSLKFYDVEEKVVVHREDSPIMIFANYHSDEEYSVDYEELATIFKSAKEFLTFLSSEYYKGTDL